MKVLEFQLVDTAYDHNIGDVLLNNYGHDLRDENQRTLMATYIAEEWEDEEIEERVTDWIEWGAVLTFQGEKFKLEWFENELMAVNIKAEYGELSDKPCHPDCIEYLVPHYFCTALEYDCFDDLDQNERDQLEAFFEKEKFNFSKETFSFYGSYGFAKSNDLNNVGSDCVIYRRSKLVKN